MKLLFLALLAANICCSLASIVVKTKTIVNVGGSGSYDEIVDMPCSNGNQQCLRQPKQVSGCLSPFDEEQTLKLRGPMEVNKIAVYYPSGGSWNRISYFDKAGSMDNMVFMGNYGRAEDGISVDEGSCHIDPGQNAKIVVNNDDFMCHGYNTSYVSSDGKCASKTAGGFMGHLEDGVEVNIMQATMCDDTSCGYFRGRGQRGWAGVNGGTKMFAAQVRFPIGPVLNSPALWFLHASVCRTANYHPGELCNCRGMGAQGGCGELDIAEVVTELQRKMDVDTTIYSFKGTGGDQMSYKFERPVDREVVFVTIFNGSGYIQILMLDPSEFNFSGSLSDAIVDELNGRRELIIKMPGVDDMSCNGLVCHYPMSMGSTAGFTARIQDGVICKFPNGRSGSSVNPITPSYPDIVITPDIINLFDECKLIFGVHNLINDQFHMSLLRQKINNRGFSWVDINPLALEAMTKGNQFNIDGFAKYFINPPSSSTQTDHAMSSIAGAQSFFNSNSNVNNAGAISSGHEDLNSMSQSGTPDINTYPSMPGRKLRANI